MADTIPFHCPVCGANRQVPRAMLGRRARCPECSELVEIVESLITSTLPEIDQQADTIDVSAEASAVEEPSLEEVFSAPIRREEPKRVDVPRSTPPDEVATIADFPPLQPDSSRPPEGHAGSPPPPSPPPPGFDDQPSTGDFDPYYRWLAIPKNEQPANHYRLLGLPPFEKDPDVILNSSERQMAHVKAQAGGRNLAICQRLLSELSLARICLLDSKRKAAYDIELRAKQKTQAAAAKNAPDKSRGKGGKSKPESKPAREQQPASRFEKGPSIAAYKVAGPEAETAALELVPLPEPAIVELIPLDEPAAPPVHPRWKGTPEHHDPPTESAEEQEEHEEPVAFTRRPVEGEMDMTPMIDVTFLLLIFFICTASFALIMTKEIPAPKEDEPSTNATSIQEFEDDPDYITIRIDAYNTFRVITPDMDDEAPSYQELLLKLRAAKQGGGANGKVPTSLMVIVNSQAKHKTQVMALDAGTEVGMEKMQLMTVEHDDE